MFTPEEVRQIRKLLRIVRSPKGLKVTLKARKTRTQVVGRLKAR